jgi:DDE family transposase
MSKPSAQNNRKLAKIQAVAPTSPMRGSLPELPAEWDSFSRVLEVDLEQLARETKALVRKRKVRCAQDLLRMVLAYALWDWSFQLVGAWATVLGLGSLSGVAVRQRLRQSRTWLSSLLGSWLRQASQPLGGRPVRLRLIDASVITQPGSRGTDWRVHLSFDVGAMRLDEFEITDAHGGETLARHTAAPGEIEVADRGYAHRAGLGSVLARAAQFVVRLNGHNLPLETAAGERIDLRRWLRGVPHTQQQQTRPVWLTSPQGRFELRLVARRLPAAAAAAASRRSAKASRKKGHTPSATSRLMAHWVLLVTNLPSADWSPTEVLALYRIRWQVELLIKRCKSLLHLDQLRAQDPEVAQVYLLGKALGVLLLHDGLRQQTQDLAEWFDDERHPLSPWRWLAFWFEHLRAVVRGHITLAMIQAALPQLKRYLCDAPRKRRQQLATTRHWLHLLNAPHPMLPATAQPDHA